MGALPPAGRPPIARPLFLSPLLFNCHCYHIAVALLLSLLSYSILLSLPARPLPARRLRGSAPIIIHPQPFWGHRLEFDYCFSKGLCLGNLS